MSKYETYKESDFVGIGKVPEHWEVKRLKHLGEAIIGLTYSPNDVTENEEGILVLRSSNIQEGFIAYDDCVYVDKEVNPNLITRKGDILICARNGSAHLVGKNICIDEKSAGHTFGAFMVVFRGKYWRYLSYFFNSPIFTSQTGMFSTTTINQLTSQTLNNLRIAYPSDSIEQENICNYLDDQTQKIDRLIANKKAQAEKLKELRQIEINNAVTKGQNPNVEMKDSGIEWLGKIPKHWELKKIKQLLKPEKNAIKTGPFGSDLKFEDLIEEGIKVYNQRSVLDNDWKSGEGYISAEKYESLKTCTIFPDDIVITTRGTIGKVSIFPADAELGILHPCLMRIQMNSQRILNDYLKIIINDSSFFFEALKLASNATTIDVIYSDSLKEVKIPVPPTNEQVEITTYLQKRVSAIDQLIKNIEAQIEKLQELRKIKIYEAVTGKIKVNAYAETTA
jgi:type I restriction enzyme S subunit